MNLPIASTKLFAVEAILVDSDQMLSNLKEYKDEIVQIIYDKQYDYDNAEYDRRKRPIRRFNRFHLLAFR